jgi:serine/threonine-protein kinase
MLNRGFWRSDWFTGLAIALLLLLLSGSELLQGLERKAYDWGVRLASAQPSDRVAVIAIDDQSIANIGRWPWSREVHARVVDILAQAQAKVIGNTVFFAEPQFDPHKNPAHAGLVRMVEAFDRPALREATGALAADLQELEKLARSTEDSLNTDRKLAASVKSAGNVALAMVFQQFDREPIGNPDRPLPDYVARNAVAAAAANLDATRLPFSVLLPIVPIRELGEVSAGVGHLNSHIDVDGSVRHEALVVRHYDQYLPSLALLLAARSLNIPPREIQVHYGDGVQLGRLRIRTDAQMLMLPFFYRGAEGRPAFAPDSFFDVYSGRIPPEKYRDRIVLIGATAAGVGTITATPIATDMPPILTLAHSVSSILQEHFFVAPAWGVWVKWGAFLLVVLYLTLLLPRLGAGLGAIATGGLFLLAVSVHFALMVTRFTWVELMTPLVLLAVGHLALTTRRYLATERGKQRSDLDLAQSNRMLGLGYQGQGQLDTAFDYFRRLPLDESVLDLLYNLGLDFERKRQFNKAESVFRYMAGYDAKFRDIEQRLARAQKMAETVVLGGATARTNTSTMVLDNPALEKPMLGRFQIEKELGKGAMGVVYQGSDPKIGRVVAIKTMALAQEFDADELADVRERFFREAQTAGRLNHPHIVTIFDTGEEHDLAYIAMEFLKGRDLVPHTRPDALLPLPRVISIVARVAEALAYAHRNHVVHRDVKPANIMYEAASDTVKVTDFGIARITDSSKTKTGMVLGTPSYMSPEQLSGKKIDGQSDLFSLGVTLFQLTCGRLPFVGESMAQLMFKIANEETPDVRTLRPDVPDCLAEVIARSTAKDPARRYADGDEMAKALRECGAAFEVTEIGL